MIYIYKAFRDGQIQLPKRKLVAALQGPVEYPHEDDASASNHPRNIMFEFFIIAMFKNAGFFCDNRTDADLLFQSDDYPVYVECKRPMKLTTILKNVKRANQQLRNRIGGTLGLPRGRGLVALSLTKIVNPNQRILRFPDEESMRSELQRMLREAHTHIQQQTDLKNIVDRKVVGWIGVVSLPVFVESRNFDVSIFAQSIFINITNRIESEHEAINKMGRAVQSSFSFEP